MTALICGVSGQDGAYLSQLLLNKGYIVYGGSRDVQGNSFENLKFLGINTKIKFVSINLNDLRSVLQVIKQTRPTEIYNLAGQSSVGLSFEQPVETTKSIAVATLNILEAIRFSEQPIKLYNAGSSECFGDTRDLAADEETPFRPRSPYATAKVSAFWTVANYREAYSLFACTGILFNHESPLRPQRFVTSKIIDTLCRISKGSSEKLILGNIEIERDWGWAPEYVDAMWRMLQQDTAEDFVIATGTTSRLKDFIQLACNYLGLDMEEYVLSDKRLYRPTDLSVGKANPAKAYLKLNWKTVYKLEDIIKAMVDDRITGN